MSNDLEYFIFKYVGTMPLSNHSQYKKLCGEKLRKCRIQRVSIQDIEKIKFPCYSTRNVDELTKFLKENGQSLLNFK